MLSGNLLAATYTGSWLCGEDGAFDPLPVLTFDFPLEMEGSLPGLTITWSTAYNEWAALFRLTAFCGEDVLVTRTVRNDAVSTVMEGDLQGYTKITLEVLRWSKPFHRARVESVVFGIEKVYSKPDIMNYTAVMSVDPLSAELPRVEITFQLKNLNGTFNPDNPEGVEKYLMERQRVTATYGYELGDGVERIAGAVCYLSEWETPQNGITATFTARDATEFMSDLYTGPTAGTLARIARAAFEQAELPSLADGGERWEIHPSLERIFLPEQVDLSNCTIAEVLQYVANAACCVLYPDRKGKWHIRPLILRKTDYSIDRFNSFADSELKLSKPLKAVDINRGQYVLTAGRAGETQPVTNPLITDDQAPAVAQWAAQFLSNRRNLSGQFRADPRLDPLDIITNVNQFSTSQAVVTEVRLTYNGAFRGSYAGRGADHLLGPWPQSGELRTGEG